MSTLMTLRPRLSEKVYAMSQTLHTYAFTVPNNANKQTVEAAVSEQFGVSVVSVNIMNVKGKPKRSVRKNGRSVNGSRNDTKKAYVTIPADQIIPIFAAEEAADAKEAKAAKKTAAKAEKKDKK